ncbi:MAG: hypothetical protein EAZ79_16690 [Oscillatoriales cyanobacterium]|nr:MAG: hypothetical protein EAZ79_16690 [Oscillatoriales cyanobacterium]
MKTTKIGFGVNNYENFRIYIEADLEPDEDCTLALDFLRTRVADEIGFPQYYLDLRSKLVNYFSSSDLPDIGTIVTGVQIPQINFGDGDDDSDDGDDGDCFESDSFEG